MLGFDGRCQVLFGCFFVFVLLPSLFALPPEMSFVLRRSRDGGKTWSQISFEAVENFELSIAQVRSSQKGKVLFACAEANPYILDRSSYSFDDKFKTNAGSFHVP